MNLYANFDWSSRSDYLRAQSWSRAVLAAIRARLDAGALSAGDVPDLPGGWVHDYVCPEHWLPLRYDPQTPSRHTCPLGETHTGERFDAGWRVLRHRALAEYARDTGLLARLTGAEPYARAAADILLAYGGRYTRFAGDSDAQPWMLKGRAFNQALTEALWAVPLTLAYAFVYPALSTGQIGSIRRNLLKPIAATLTAAHDALLDQGRLASNYTAWLICAIGHLGLALDDATLLRRAIDGPGGFRAHLAAAIRADGFEHEGSPYYHNFVALAYSLLAEAVHHAGGDLYAMRGPDGQSARLLWEALASLALPDGDIPRAADGAYWPGSVFDVELCDVYEIALARTVAPLYGALLHHAYARRDAARDRWTALLFAAADIDEAEPLQPSSTCLPHSGLAVLRSPDSAQSVSIAFGPCGGGHTHRDRLSLQIWPWSRDPGNPPYGISARRDWYQHTHAHNALLVDGQSQAFGQAQVLRSEDGSLCLQSDMLYPGITLTRTITLELQGIADVTEADSPDEHCYEWLCHADEAWTIPDLAMQPLNEPCAEEGPGAFVTLAASGCCPGALTASTAYAGRAYTVRLESEIPFEILLGRCPGSDQAPYRSRHVIIARIRGQQCRFTATYRADS